MELDWRSLGATGRGNDCTIITISRRFSLSQPVISSRMLVDRIFVGTEIPLKNDWLGKGLLACHQERLFDAAELPLGDIRSKGFEAASPVEGGGAMVRPVASSFKFRGPQAYSFPRRTNPRPSSIWTLCYFHCLVWHRNSGAVCPGQSQNLNLIHRLYRE